MPTTTMTDADLRQLLSDCRNDPGLSDLGRCAWEALNCSDVERRSSARRVCEREWAAAQ